MLSVFIPVSNSMVNTLFCDMGGRLLMIDLLSNQFCYLAFVSLSGNNSYFWPNSIPISCDYVLSRLR
uniref:Uncharacterized protein n=1 Tax=Octopus bimaculoides TaxID=37653 RepID=A0A0L8HM40_OCTBM